jgi:hypothetical protein
MVEQAKVVAELFKIGLYSEHEARIALDSIGWIPIEYNDTQGEPEAHGGVGFYISS